MDENDFEFVQIFETVIFEFSSKTSKNKKMPKIIIDLCSSSEDEGYQSPAILNVSIANSIRNSPIKMNEAPLNDAKLRSRQYDVRVNLRPGKEDEDIGKIYDRMHAEWYQGTLVYGHRV